MTPTTSKSHISSLYVRESGTGSTFAEVGWCSEIVSGSRKVRFFGARMYGGMYYDLHFQDAPLGTNHFYTVRHISGSEDWGFWVDGVLKGREKMLGWKSGWSTASSERGNTSDTNYSHFWGLQSRNSSATWYNWSNLEELTDNDPNYYLNKISDTEVFMQQ